MGLLAEFPLAFTLCILFVAFLGGMVKGIVGFGLPLILISTLAAFLPPEQALAAVLLSLVVTNYQQAIHAGFQEAREIVAHYKILLTVLIASLVVSANFVLAVSPATLNLIIGSAIILFSLLMLLGWVPRLYSKNKRRDQIVCAIIAGGIGGMSGIWGPPVVIYLAALNLEKRNNIAIQGVIYAVGATGFGIAHIYSGILNDQTAALSIALVAPSVLGMWVGGKVNRFINQATFRRMTLIILVLAGLNLFRQGLFLTP